MLERLIKDQTIIVDAHKRGTGENISWDMSRNDIHIDKRTNRRINKRFVEVIIKIPINSDQPIKVVIKENVPKPVKALTIAENQIVGEIYKAFEDPEVREAFVLSLLETFRNHPTILSNVERARAVMSRLVKHFGLPGNLEQEMIRQTERHFSSYSALVTVPGHSYYINLNENNITIGETTLEEYRSTEGGRR